MSRATFNIDPRLTCAAAYGRKSTNQERVSDDQTSVATQIAEGTEAAAEIHHFIGPKATCVFEDFDVSGAEFDNRPGWSRLMALVKSGRAPFKILIVRNVSRIGREPIEALMNLKWLDQAGIRVYSYLDREFYDMTDETKVMMLMIKTFAAGSQRATGRKEVLAAMQRKARAGHVISILAYGYERVEVRDGGDKRSHVTQRIVKTEAAVIQRIYAMKLQGRGRQVIGRALDADGIKPRRGTRWTATTIGTILANEIYRGEIVSHRHVYRDHWGQKLKHGTRLRPESEWIRVQREDLRIVSDAVWYAVEALRTQQKKARAAVLASGKSFGGPPRDKASAYLLSGFARCRECGGPICAIRRDVAKNGLLASTGATGSVRRAFYACLNYHRYGRATCSNATSVLVERMHDGIRAAMLDRITKPGVVDSAIKRLVQLRSASTSAATAARLKTAITKAEREYKQLRAALTLAKRPLPSLVADMEERETTLDGLRRQLAAVDVVPTESADALAKRARKELKGVLEALRSEDVAATRQLLRRVLVGSIMLTPAKDTTRAPRHRNQHGPRRDTRAYHFEGYLSLKILFSGTVVDFPTSDVSHTASDTSWKQVFQGISA